MAGVTKKDRIRNTELRRKTKVEDIILRTKRASGDGRPHCKTK